MKVVCLQENLAHGLGLQAMRSERADLMLGNIHNLQPFEPASGRDDDRIAEACGSHKLAPSFSSQRSSIELAIKRPARHLPRPNATPAPGGQPRSQR